MMFDIISFVSIVFSSFYLAGITSYSPVYFVALISLFLFVIVIFIKKEIRLVLYDYLVLVLIFYFFVVHYLIYNNINAIPILSSYILFFIVSLSLRYVSDRHLLRTVFVFILFSVVFYLTDMFYRFSADGMYNDVVFALINSFGGERYFDEYKVSLAFADTNSVGFLSLCFFWFSVYMFDYRKEKIYFYFALIWFVLVVFSYSRSSWVAFIVTLIIAFYKKYSPKGNVRIIFSVLLLLVAILVGSWVYKIFLNDMSFNSKLYLFDVFKIYYSGEINPWQIFFGIGVRNSVEKFGIYTHIHFITYIVEYGIIGFLLIISLWFSVYKASFNMIDSLFNSFFIMGFSFVPISLSYLYIMIVLIIYFERKKRKATDPFSP